MVREFAQKEVECVACQIDKDHSFPANTVKRMAELSLMGIPFPEEYGGSDLGAVSFAIAVEELSPGLRLHRRDSVDPYRPGRSPPFFSGARKNRNKNIWFPLAAGEYLGAFCPDRVRRRHGRFGHRHHGGCRRRRLYPERGQDFHHQRRPGRHLYRHGHDRQVQRHQRHFSLYRGKEISRFSGRAVGGETGASRVRRPGKSYSRIAGCPRKTFWAARAPDSRWP